MSISVKIKKKFPGFNLDIAFEGSKERIGLLGASGSGKSMTLRCIAGLVHPDEGKIVVNGMTFFDSEQKVNIKPQSRKVGYLFQNYALFPHLSIQDNIAFGIAGLTESQRLQKVMALLEKFHLTGLEKRYPHQISGGQQQRVALARTLATEPQILLLDEPFSALDEHLRSHMTQEMLQLLNEFDGSTLFVTHNMEEAYRICENLTVLSHGKMHAFGTKKEVFENPKTSEAARITGCKNIAAAKINQGRIEVPSWHIQLKSNAQIQSNTGYCGVRANHIAPAFRNVDDNVFRAKIVANIETPFRQTVYLKFENGINDCADYHIQWEMSKDKWDMLEKDAGFIRIHLPKENVMYFET